MITDEHDTAVTTVELTDLAADLKRMLKVQIKEFVHNVEDVEYEQARLSCPEITQSTVARSKPFRRVA